MTVTAMVSDIVQMHPAVTGARPGVARGLNDGRRGVSATITDFTAFRAPAAACAERPALSRREVEVLLAWLAADSKDEAAGSLFISASTVSTHISRIRNKYSAVGRPARTKAHLLARALQDGYTTLAEW